MTIRAMMIGWTALATVLGTAGMASAQDTPPPPPPPPQEEVMGATAAPPTPAGPEWWAFSRGDTRNYLIDVNSVARDGDEMMVNVARVPKDTVAGDYSHTVDRFGVKCDAKQSHVVTSTDVYETGEGGDTYPAEEEYTAIAPDSFDEAIRDIGCDGARPEGPPYPSVNAYIDAGRP